MFRNKKNELKERNKIWDIIIVLCLSPLIGMGYLFLVIVIGIFEQNPYIMWLGLMVSYIIVGAFGAYVNNRGNEK